MRTVLEQKYWELQMAARDALEACIGDDIEKATEILEQAIEELIKDGRETV
jgi:hypothetical protein